MTRHFNHSGYLILEKLIEKKFNVVGVVLHDEKKLLNTRYLNYIPRLIYKLKCWYYRCDPLKTLNSEEVLAKKKGLNVLKTHSIKSDSFYEKLKRSDPDIIVLGGGWHELLPERVFSYPPLGCINTHPSLLPEFRGTSITRWQVLHGVNKSGSTIHYVNDEFDKGGVLAQKACQVSPKVTPQELFYKLGQIGGDIMVKLLRSFEREDQLETYEVEHNEKYYSYFSKWSWNVEKLKIDWQKSVKDIHYFVKANTQESYQYLGPIFKYRHQQYFLRKTRLVKKEKVDFDSINFKKDKFSIVKRGEGTVSIYRPGEEYILEVIQLQKFDSIYFLRRAKAASQIITEQEGKVVKLS